MSDSFSLLSDPLINILEIVEKFDNFAYSGDIYVLKVLSSESSTICKMKFVEKFQAQISLGFTEWKSLVRIGFIFPFSKDLINSIPFEKADFGIYKEHIVVFVLCSLLSWISINVETGSMNDIGDVLLSLIFASQICYPCECISAYHQIFALISKSPDLIEEQMVLKSLFYLYRTYPIYSKQILISSCELFFRQDASFFRKNQFFSTIEKVLCYKTPVLPEFAQSLFKLIQNNMVKYNYIGVHLLENIFKSIRIEHVMSFLQDIAQAIVDLSDKTPIKYFWPNVSNLYHKPIRFLCFPRSNQILDFCQTEIIDLTQHVLFIIQNNPIYLNQFLQSYINRIWSISQISNAGSVFAHAVYVFSQHTGNPMIVNLIKSPIFNHEIDIFTTGNLYPIISSMRDSIITNIVRSNSSFLKLLFDDFKYGFFVSEMLYRIMYLQKTLFEQFLSIEGYCLIIISLMKYIDESMTKKDSSSQFLFLVDSFADFLEVAVNNIVFTKLFLKNGDFLGLMLGFIIKTSNFGSFIKILVKFIIGEPIKKVETIVLHFVSITSEFFRERKVSEFFDLMLQYFEFFICLFHECPSVFKVFNLLLETVSHFLGEINNDLSAQDLIVSFLFTLDVSSDDLLSEKLIASLEKSISLIFNNDKPEKLCDVLLMLSLPDNNQLFQSRIPYFGLLCSSSLDTNGILLCVKWFTKYTKSKKYDHNVLIYVLDAIKKIDPLVLSQKEALNEMLMLFDEISNNYSSPKIIIHFFDTILFFASNGNLQCVLSMLFSLQSMLLKDYLLVSPSFLMNTIHTIKQETGIDIGGGFSIVNWVNIISFEDEGFIPYIHISLSKNNSFRIEFSKNLLRICFNETITHTINISLYYSEWFLFILTFRFSKENTEVLLNVNNKDINSIVFPPISRYLDYYQVLIGSDLISNSLIELSDFGVFPLLPHVFIQKIYEDGPLRLDSKFKKNSISNVLISKNKESFPVESFANLLRLSWKCDLIIPIFALLNYQNDEDHYNMKCFNFALSILTKMVLFNEEVQEIFLSRKYTHALSWIFQQYNENIINYCFYRKIYSFFISIDNSALKMELFDQILTNMSLWIVAKPNDIEKILEHWLYELYPSFLPLCCQVSAYLDVIKMCMCYFWYDSSSEYCIGSPKAKRQRNSNIDIVKCRELIKKLIIMYIYDSISFLSLEKVLDLLRLDDYKNNDWILELVLGLIIKNDIQFMKTKPTNKFLSILLENIRSGNDNTCANSIDILDKLFQLGSISPDEFHNLMLYLINIINLNHTKTILFHRVFSLFTNGNYQLLPLLSCIATNDSIENQKQFSKFLKEQPYDKKWSRYPDWILWPLLVLIRTDELNIKSICSFIFSQDPDHLRYVIIYIDYLCDIYNINSLYIKRLYFDTIIEIIENNKSFIRTNGLVSTILFHLFYRKMTQVSIFEIESSNEQFSPSFINPHLVLSLYQSDYHFKPGYIPGIATEKQNYWNSSRLAIFLIENCPIGLYPEFSSVFAFLERINSDHQNIYKNEDNHNQVDFNLIFEDCLLTINKLYPFDYEREWNNLINRILAINNSLNQFIIYNGNIPEIHSSDKSDSSVENYFNTIIKEQRVSWKSWMRLWFGVSQKGCPWSRFSSKNTTYKRENSFCFSNCPFKIVKKKQTNDYRIHYWDNQNTIHIQQHDFVLENTIHFNMPLVSYKCKIEGNNDDSCKVTIVKIKECIEGILIIKDTTIEIHYTNKPKIIIIPFSCINQIYTRNRFHINTAIEIFSVFGHCLFIDFLNETTYSIAKRIISKCPNNCLIVAPTISLANFVKGSFFVEEWINGKISNFEYLMYLNMISGRSFNDQSQYPIFPWILSDYKSNNIDFSDEGIYRNLSCPIGAQTIEKVNHLKDYYDEISRMGETPYMYSSGPISPLSLCLYLLRIEPFTSSHISLQGGKFDLPSRLFSSMNTMYSIVTKSLNSNWELSPEFFFMPEFLTNINNLELGTIEFSQVNNVQLPPWAKNPLDFIYKHRKALESVYVSSHLNDWIDLFWGYKQRGKESFESHNVYSCILYDDVWKRNNISKDEINQILAFLKMVGQIPPQLFSSSHPKKLSKQILPSVIFRIGVHVQFRASSICQKSGLVIRFLMSGFSIQKTKISLANNDELYNEDKYQANPNDSKFVFDFSTLIFVGSNNDSYFCVFNDGMIVKISYKDGKFLINNLPKKVFKTISISDKWILIAFSDSTLDVYNHSNYKTPLFSSISYHDIISCSCINEAFKVFLIGSESSSIIVYSLTNGDPINVIDLEGLKPKEVYVSNGWGFIIVIAFSGLANYLVVYSINGIFVKRIKLSFKIVSLCTWTSQDGFDFCAYITEDSKVFITEVYYLNPNQLGYRINLPVSCMSYSHDFRSLCIIEKQQIQLLPIE